MQVPMFPYAQLELYRDITLITKRPSRNLQRFQYLSETEDEGKWPEH